MLATVKPRLTKFLSTPSARRATHHAGRQNRGHEISIHALREEGDIWRWPKNTAGCVFLSTPSARRATPPAHRRLSYQTDFYPRPPRGGRPMTARAGPTPSRISIHALREEGDGPWMWAWAPSQNFYPRPPRGGRRPTPAGQLHHGYFYPRPPRGGRQPGAGDAVHRILISIHALREEGDPASRCQSWCPWDFYPRPPRGGRRWMPSQTSASPYFYPRPPRGGRHEVAGNLEATTIFLSTPSARRATSDPGGSPGCR